MTFSSEACPGRYPGWIAVRVKKTRQPKDSSAVDDRHGAGPARRRAFDLDRETRHGETGRRQLLEIVQLFDVAIADVPPGLVAFPDQAGVFGLGILLCSVDERCVPAPAVDAGQPYACLLYTS